MDAVDIVDVDLPDEEIDDHRDDRDHGDGDEDAVKAAFELRQSRRGGLPSRVVVPFGLRRRRAALRPRARDRPQGESGRSCTSSTARTMNEHVHVLR